MRFPLPLALIGLLTACTGTISGTPQSDGASAGSTGATPGSSSVAPVNGEPVAPGLLTTCDPTQAAAPPQRVWMLTPEQIAESVAGLYEGGPSGPAIDAVTAENRTYDGNDADLVKLNTEQVRGLIHGADEVGKFVAANLTQLTSCVPAEADCFTRLMTDFVTRAWRTPPAPEQLSRLQAVYAIGAEVSVADGYAAAIAAVLKSPRFLFRTELGSPDGAGHFRLSAWELASQLSYLLLDAPPDGELRSLAASGALSSPEVFSQQAGRLLADPRVHGIASRFVFQLTSARSVHGLAKSPAVVEKFDASVTDALLTELRLFSERVFFDGAGDVRALLTSQQSEGDATVAALYGLPGAGSGTGPLALGPTRAGLLTMPLLMSILSQADHVVPTARGRFVRDKLLCKPIAAPPKFPKDAPAANPELSPRDRLAVMQGFPACAACHNLADPIGFAFDNFDPVGRYVTEVKGKPVDASGEIKGTELSDGSFANVAELAEKLAASPEVRACLNWQFFEFSQGRAATAADQCRIWDSQQAFEKAGGRLNTLLDQALSFDTLTLRSASR